MNKEQIEAFEAIPGIKCVWVVYTSKGIDSVWTTQERAHAWLDYLYNKGCRTKYKVAPKELDNEMS